MLPVSIITGFLGSGKTTLLNGILQHPSFKKSMVIINEFGEIGIDHLLVSTPVENIRLLSNGCLCCAVKGDLVETLTDIFRRRATGEIPSFDRVLVETTGLADPVPVMQTVVTDDQVRLVYRLTAVAAVVDAVHALSQLENHYEARKQVAVADVLLLSKPDLTTSAALSEVEAALQLINRFAAVVPALHGDVDPTLLFGDRSLPQHGDGGAAGGLTQASTELAPSGKSHGNHARDIQTFTMACEGRVSRVALGTWLSMLASFRGAHLLRVKGIVNVEGRPYVVNAVQTVIHEPIPLLEWPTSDERTRVVFIVQGFERSSVEKAFAALSMTRSLGDTPRFDPTAYAHFQELAQHFVGTPES